MKDYYGHCILVPNLHTVTLRCIGTFIASSLIPVKLQANFCSSQTKLQFQLSHTAVNNLVLRLVLVVNIEDGGRVGEGSGGDWLHDPTFVP